MRFFLLRYVVLPASRGGKLKTVLQFVAIGLYLLPLDQLPTFVTVAAQILMAAALVVTVVTGLERAHRPADQPRREPPARRRAVTCRSPQTCSRPSATAAGPWPSPSR